MLTTIHKLIIFIFLLTITHMTHASWKAYPSSLPQFDYSGDALQRQWSTLAHLTYTEFPDKVYLDKLITQYPELMVEFKKITDNGTAHPHVVALVQGDAKPYLQGLQDVWRQLFEGKFEQAYKNGIALGGIAVVPALQAKMDYIHFFVPEKKAKLKQLQQLLVEIQTLNTVKMKQPFQVFGEIYCKARILELLKTSKAQASGYLRPSIKTLQRMIETHPKRGIYKLMLGRIYAGVVEKVGSFLGNLTYGASSTKALALASQSLKQSPRYPVTLYEYATVLETVDTSAHKTIKKILTECTKLTPVNAEEALNQALCNKKLQQLNQ